MKTNLKLYYSKDTADPKKIYLLRVALKKASRAVEILAWTAAPEEEKKAVNFLLLTFMNQLMKQQKTVLDLSEPILTWENPDSSRDIRIGYEDILKEL